jgi:polyhydroxybutyrate depolymerase
MTFRLSARGVLLSLALAACTKYTVPTGAPLVAGSRIERIDVEGAKREYVLHLPKDFDAHSRLPLVLVLHGYGGNAAGMERESRLSLIADSARFIVAYPNGVKGIVGGRHWTPMRDRDADVTFLSNLIDTLTRRYGVDSARVYVAGFSNGAVMTYWLGSVLSQRLAAIGAVAGTIGRRGEDGRMQMIPAPAHPLSVVVIHGLHDDVMPYDSTHAVNRARGAGAISAPGAVAFWRTHNECAPTPRVDTVGGGTTVHELYGPCARGTAVAFYTVTNATHLWETLDGHDKDGRPFGVDAGDLLWRFFSDKRLQ